MLSVSGAIIGVGVAFAGIWGLEQLFPEFPLSIPLWAFVAAVTVAIGTGLLFGVLPARRAAAMDPVTALAGR